MSFPGKVRRRACGQHTSEAMQRANAGQVLPQSMGIPRARARLPKSPSEATQELLFLCRRGKVEAWKHRLEPPVLEPGELSVSSYQQISTIATIF